MCLPVLAEKETQEGATQIGCDCRAGEETRNLHFLKLSSNADNKQAVEQLL
mgnify:CR=1 FL=1